MRVFLLSICFSVFIGLSAWASVRDIHPVPQSVQGTGRLFKPGCIIWDGKNGSYADIETLLRQIFPGQREKNGTCRIYAGRNGDRSVKAYASRIPAVPGGYYLQTSRNKIVIAGFDERGVFYAVQTLAQLYRNDSLPEVQITDFPTVAYRGVVEGFYGRPWSHADRLSQLKFYGQCKLNTYIYGPKDDPYHSSPHWRQAYPEKEAQHISELVRVARANQVDFVWAVHPGQDIRWNDEDRRALLGKFDKMYQLGVRSFAVFFDDISGEGTDPARQAELLNFLQTEFVARKPDVTPLIMCPTEYNKSWSNPEPGSYLDILGEQLDSSVMVMWTGDRVISDINRSGLDWINKRIKRPAYVWWNFPVNDYVRDHLLLGPAYGLDTAIRKEMGGFVCNPMERAEASKIGIYGVADYAWNPGAYEAENSWRSAIHYLLPRQAEALQVFAAHNSDPGKNGHGYRREESVAIKPRIDQFLTSYREHRIHGDLTLINDEFYAIRAAADSLLKATENPDLIREIGPWVKQFRILGQAGIEVILSILNVQPENIWIHYIQVLEKEKQRKDIDAYYNQNPYQPGVKTGSLVMQPFIDSLSAAVALQLYTQLSGNRPSAVAALKPELRTDIRQLENLALQYQQGKITLPPVLEVIKLRPGQYFNIELPVMVGKSELFLDLQSPQIAQWGKLQTSEDGEKWKIVKTDHFSDTSAISLEDRFKFIRFIHAGKGIREISLKRFTIRADMLDKTKNSAILAQDQDLKTAYLLPAGQELLLANPLGKEERTVTVLLGPEMDKELTISVIVDGTGKKEWGKIKAPFSQWSCPVGTTAVTLTTGIAGKGVEVYEVIWK